MMRISIKYRLFMAILAASAIVVLCMFLIMQWSINRGFLQYVNTQEQERLETLADELQQYYEEQGSWKHLHDQPAQWLRLLIRTYPVGELSPEQMQRLERRLERRFQRGGFGQPDNKWQPFERRLVLLDADHQPVFGIDRDSKVLIFKTIEVDGHAVGYLGLQPRRRLNDVQQLRFVKQQTLALALVGGVLLVVSALMALPVAKHLVRPIRTLAAATHRLSAGEYATRVPPAGSDELAQLAKDFNHLARVLEKNEQARRLWVADISHELRTPLAVLRGEIEALQDGVRPFNPETLDSLHGEALHLGRLVEDLYQLSLSDLGALTYRKENADVGSVLLEAVEPYRLKFSTKDISLQLTEPKTPTWLFVDQERLHQLFVNLLENSLRYTDVGGCLAISLETKGEQIIIEFSDTAPGVPPADLERLFERLYRREASRNRASGGAGLGLAICRNIVEAHGGRISAGESPLGGVTVHIELPNNGEEA